MKLLLAIAFIALIFGAFVWATPKTKSDDANYPPTQSE